MLTTLLAALLATEAVHQVVDLGGGRWQVRVGLATPGLGVWAATEWVSIQLETERKTT